MENSVDRIFRVISKVQCSKWKILCKLGKSIKNKCPEYRIIGRILIILYDTENPVPNSLSTQYYKYYHLFHASLFHWSDLIGKRFAAKINNPHSHWISKKKMVQFSILILHVSRLKNWSWVRKVPIGRFKISWLRVFRLKVKRIQPEEISPIW